MVGSPANWGSSSVCELLGRGIHIRGVDELVDRLRSGLRRREGYLGRDPDILLHAGPDVLQLRFARHALGEQPCREGAERIPLCLLLSLLGHLVHDLVVRQRVRVRSDHVGVDQRRPAPAPDVLHRPAEPPVAEHGVEAVHLGHVQAGERPDGAWRCCRRGLHLDGHRDRVLVVLDQEEDGKAPRFDAAQIASVELALAGRAPGLRRRIPARTRTPGGGRRRGHCPGDAPRLGVPDRLEVLRPRTG